MRINIVYDDNEFFYCLFWNSFFKSIGIVCEMSNRKDYQKKDNKNDQIYISKTDLENLDFLHIMNMNSDEIKTLLEIFIKYRLWYVTWIYANFSRYFPKYNEYIRGNMFQFVTKAKNEIKNHISTNYSDKKYTRFFYHFIDYLTIYFEELSMMEKYKKTENLLSKISPYLDEKKLYEKELAFYSQYCILGGKICGLSNMTRNYQKNYYFSIPKDFYDSDLCFRIGRWFSKLYGLEGKNKEKVKEFYKQSLAIDKNNFKSQYCLAIMMNQKSYDYFMKVDYIRYMLSTTVSDPINLHSLEPIEYYFKSLIECIWYVRNNLNAPSLRLELESEMKDIIDVINQSNIFETIFDEMSKNTERNLEEEKLIRNAVKRKIMSQKDYI